MHHPKFLKLEGTWRGLHYLVQNSETGTALKLRVLNITKRELYSDLSKAIEFDQSQLFKKIYENEFGTPGGEPYGALIGDYEFTNHPEDIETAAADVQRRGRRVRPFISAAGAGMFGFDRWTELSKPRDLAKIFDTVEYTKWRAFRDSEDSRFVTLVHAARARPPALRQEHQADRGVRLRGSPDGARGKALAMDHESLLLDERGLRHGRAADRRLRPVPASAPPSAAPRAAARSRACRPTCSRATTATSTRSARPRSASPTGARTSCPTSGFLPLCHYKNTDYAVFFGGQTTQKPKKYDRPEATANAAISARLPYIMATSRFAHYLKVMARDKIG